MGKMIDGTWRSDTWVRNEEGAFQRDPTTFRDSIGPGPQHPYEPQAGRYHLYVSYACPWAHRTLISRALLGLEDVIDVSVVHPHMLDEGWTFDTDFDHTTGDAILSKDFLRQIYAHADPQYTGRVTVPVLFDRHTETIVNNESQEIIRMFSTGFREFASSDLDLYPEGYRQRIDDIIDAIYQPINNGVYRAGFATTQEAYNSAVSQLFEALDHWNKHLQSNRYLAGDVLSEADICLFTTLIRFDPVYYGHFKCNLRHVYEFDALWGHTKEIYHLPGVADTCHFDHIQGHYYYSHRSINPTQVVPRGPILDRLDDPGRDHLPGALARR